MVTSDVQRSTADPGPSAEGNCGRTFGPGRSLRHAAKVLPEHARAHNRSLVLQTLFHQGAMSRADLSRETGLTRVTISDLIAEIIEDGYVAERGTREVTGPGKPAILVDLDREGHRIIGLDLSRSDRFLGAVLTLDGEIVARHEASVPADPADILATVIRLTRELVADAHAPVLGVGVGSPGIVDDHGTVLTAPNLRWTDIDLEGILRAEVSLPVLVANDANAALLAEYTFGGAGDDVMLVRVGRGVGSGLLSGGQPMPGGRFAAGEIGHVTVGTDGGPVCVCGKVGCLEAWLSVPSLERALAEEGADATAVLRDAGERLGIALAPIVGALDLSEIVLSGPSPLLDGPLAEATVETLRARTLAEFHDGVQVRMTEQGEDIVLRGAAVMVLSGQLGVS
ncbi:ROK family transcriptional regulator [Microbacterium lacticum]|uniref:Putative NBD/HSP70 family sugar kinase n=1 Tax=Microbacterium lacticum TaxID=33885 RepID=A0A4Y3UH13_9MICO|nr:ROK family transcriptional regulator [Microbacterium lacticum]TQM90194.1 putative NBD/HSP70 family sugar kinase [Microbacterium lacticum]GEB93926.1 NagC family transcriptional regulator [Microbacterium lacticum]GGN11983.1 NagC family transcriptional regulator [Microbacterium lacticum]